MNKSWIKKGIYQLMVDRFNGGWQNTSTSVNDFCGGTIRGIIDRLDYIKALGCYAIMLSPVFKTETFHGYHTLNITNHLKQYTSHKKGLEVNI